MRLNLSALAVRERAVTLFFIILLAAAGIYAFVNLGRAEDVDGDSRMARRNGARDAGPCRRTDGKARSGTGMV
mgnify:CR=1 FL=1